MRSARTRLQHFLFLFYFSSHKLDASLKSILTDFNAKISIFHYLKRTIEKNKIKKKTKEETLDETLLFSSLVEEVASKVSYKIEIHSHAPHLSYTISL